MQITVISKLTQYLGFKPFETEASLCFRYRYVDVDVDIYA